MSKFRYFTLAELIASSEAKKRGIENIPDFDEVEHLSELVERFLEPLRAAWGKPIRITSGFRCEKLNRAVGGVPTSVHKIAYAADMQPIGASFESFRDFVVEWAKKSGAKFDQILLESRRGVKWIHVGLYNNAGQQRGQIKVMSL